MDQVPKVTKSLEATHLSDVNAELVYEKMDIITDDLDSSNFNSMSPTPKPKEESQLEMRNLQSKIKSLENDKKQALSSLGFKYKQRGEKLSTMNRDLVNANNANQELRKGLALYKRERVGWRKQVQQLQATNSVQAAQIEELEKILGVKQQQVVGVKRGRDDVEEDEDMDMEDVYVTKKAKS